MERGVRILAALWLFFTLAVLAVIGFLSLSLYSGGIVTIYLNDPAPRAANYFLSGSFVGNTSMTVRPVYGVVLFDNSTEARAVADTFRPDATTAPSGGGSTTVSTTRPAGPPPPPPPSPGPSTTAFTTGGGGGGGGGATTQPARISPPGTFRGLVRFELFQYLPEGALAAYMCASAVPVAMDDILSTCAFMPLFPTTVAARGGGGFLRYVGNYNCYLPGDTLTNLTEVLIVKLQDNALPSTRIVRDIWARAALGPRRASLDAASLAASNAFVSSRTAYGVYGDVSQLFLYWSSFLMLQVFGSLLLTSDRRTYQHPLLIISGLGAVADLLLGLNQERGAYGTNTEFVCVGVGFLFHLLFLAIVCWYVAASLSLLATVWSSGKYRHFALHHSRTTWIVYHATIWGFVVVNCAIIWGLTPLQLSFGPLQPWVFCWCRSIVVLYGAFFSVAIVALCTNLVVTGLLVFYALKMAQSRRAIVNSRSNSNVCVEISSIIIVVNMGVLAIGLTGLLLTVYADTVSPPIFLAAGIMFLLQALTLWIVVVFRVQTFELLFALFTCKGRRKGGSTGSTSRTNSNFAPSRKPSSEVQLRAVASTAAGDAEHGVTEL